MAAASIAGYPLQWEADVLLADGGVAHLRPSGPADTEAIRGLHGRLSAETLYLRYLSPVSTVSDQQIAVFTGADYDSRVGLVAVLGGEITRPGPITATRSGTPTRPRPRSWWRIRSRAMGSVRSCWSTWPRPLRSVGSAGTSTTTRSPESTSCTL